MAGLIDRYVADLFDYAVEHEQLENYYKYALLLIRESALGGGAQKPEIPDELEAFLKLLSGSDADAVISKFFDMAGKRLGRLEVKVFSAVPLNDKQLSEIENKMAAMFGKEAGEISLVAKVDSTLIGGLRVVVGHMIIDNTVKTRLAEMKKNVYKEVYLS